jgi:signal transduction histidine kinase
MFATAPRSSRPRRPNRLWLLAAVLGVATAHLTMSIVHDTSRQREAVRTVAQSLADQLASQLATRAELFAARGRFSGENEAFLADSMFFPALRELERANAQLVELDSGSVQLSNRDSSNTIGTLHEEHQYRAGTPARGLLTGWKVSVALRRSQLTGTLVASVPDERLWLLGLLALLTIGALIIAIGSSQRELLLARARSDFVAGVSHELRMPLAQILLAGETLALRRERSGDERAGLSRSIVREARRLVGLIDNVLFFSRSDSGRAHVRAHAVEIAALFERVVESVDLAVADAHQSIVTNAGTDITVMADPDLLRHALVNLVDNAIKYGKANQRIVLIAERSAGGRIQVHVDDEGPGIPVEERTRVFDAYERLARDQVSERTGTGLGLAIVRRIVESCGGRVWMTASPAGGARATIELDAAP